MASSQPMKKNTATTIVFPILDADGDPVTGATALDSEYSLDGAAFVDCAAEASEIGSSGIYSLALALGETNGDVVCIQVKTTSSGAKTTVLVFYTAAQTFDATDSIIDTIKQVLIGKWALISNQLIMYDTDGSTALYTFDLSQDGTATEYNPDLRSPV